MAQVYVGTYAKYNDGNLYGAWLDLEDYDYEEFIAACKELHKDEHDPELMFQDYEGFPDEYYNESSINPEVWDWLELDDSERDLVDSYLEGFGRCHGDSLKDVLRRAQDADHGVHNSFEDYVEEFIDDVGLLYDIPDYLQRYFNVKAYANDMRYDYTIVEVEDGVRVFSN